MKPVQTLKQKIIDMLRRNGPMRKKAMAGELKIPGSKRGLFRETLDELKNDGEVLKMSHGRLGLAEHAGDLIGRLDLTAKGYGFVVIEDQPGRDIFIPPSNIGGALHGDVVAIRLLDKSGGKSRRGRGRKSRKKRSGAENDSLRRVGRIVRVVERGNHDFVATYHEFSSMANTSSGREKPVGYLEPDSKRMRRMRILVGFGDEAVAKDGTRVVAELITPRPGYSGRIFTARIKEVLGEAGIASVELAAVCREYGIRTEFPPEVIAEAKAIPEDIPPEERSRREDFTTLTTVTIDPEDAKDYDDAISLQRTASGSWTLYVHIADVSHYVRPGSKIDKEAYLRGTSVYLPGLTVSMIPEKLSTRLCSLRPGENKLTRTCRMVFSPSGKLKSTRLSRSIIRSDARLSYDQARRIIDEDVRGDVSGEVFDMLGEMKELAGILRSKRMKAGSLELDMDEVRLKLDEEKNEIIAVELFQVNWTHRMIEDFMLAANRAVAEYTMNAEIAALYRVHADPDPSALEQLARFARSLGFSIRPPVDRFKIQRLLEESRNSEHREAIHFGALTSMKKAIYSAYCFPHYALAFDKYCHFTSPIRRYPDLVTHRQLAERFPEGGAVLPPAGKRPAGAASTRSAGTVKLAKVAAHCSRTERAAESAERQATRFRQLLYLQMHPRDAHDGVITRIDATGFNVLLDDSRLEGWVPVDSLPGSHTWNQGAQTLAAYGSGGRYRLGERITVRVVELDLATKELELEVL